MCRTRSPPGPGLRNTGIRDINKIITFPVCIKDEWMGSLCFVIIIDLHNIVLSMSVGDTVCHKCFMRTRGDNGQG